ncbi:MAG: hypothetical protein H5T69_04555 [Chloroflexi bacterium]|nr:hypothetical protein [Chloroflexota bacterium]
MQAATDFWIYLNIIRKRLWLIVLLLLVTEGVILSVSMTAKPVYRATVRLQVLATDTSDVSLFTQYRTSSTASEIQQAQNDFIRALKSSFVAWKTVADLNLEIGALDLLAGLSTATEGDFIKVTVESDDPGRAEAIATTQVNNALTYYRQVRATTPRVLREFVSQELKSARQEMLDAEAALLKFKQEHRVDLVGQETAALQDLIRNLKLERDRALIERDRADVFASIYRAEQAKAEAEAEAIVAMRQKAAEEQEAGAGEGAAIKATPTPTAEEEEAFAPATLKFYRDLARQHEATAIGYEAQRDGYAQSLAIYERMIEERTQELRDRLSLYAEYYALERALNQARSNYNFLWDKENEARLKQLQAEELGYIQITEPARRPDAPVPSKTLQLAVVGGVVSVLVGFVLSFLIEFLALVSRAASKTRVD